MSDNSMPTLNDLPAHEADVIQQTCARFENDWKAWRAGSPRVEAYLDQTDGAARAVLVVELVRLEVAYRVMQGESVYLEDYQQRFPNDKGVEDVLHCAGITMDASGSQPSLKMALGLASEMRESPHATFGGTGLPEYELLERVGAGGMGVVYKARDTRLNRIVALKMISPGEQGDEAERIRFKTEAEAIARLQHPNIVQIFEVAERSIGNGRPPGPFISLEFCSGGSLDRKLNGTPIPPHDAATLVGQLARAIQAAHQAHILHRDLKPANVLLTGEGVPKVTDFGLAKKLDEQSKTRTGAVMGSPSYMAPEQAQGGGTGLGPACDVYGLGAILYECLTGRPPFKAATLMETLMQVIHEEPVAPRQLNAGVPRDLETICLKCLQKEPEKRYDSALSLAEDLGRFREGNAILARPVGRVERLTKWVKRNPVVAGLLAAVLLVLLAGGAVSSAFAVRATRSAEQALKARGEAENSARAESAERKKAEELAGKEARARELADEERHKAIEERDRADRLLYATHLNEAQTAWREGYVSGAWDHLDSARWDLRGWEHDYLHTTFTKNQCTFRGHTGLIYAVAFSPDGKRIASASQDKTARVWDALTGAESLTLRGHTDQVTNVAFSPDGRRIATTSYDNTVRIWDAITGKPVLVFKGHSLWVWSAAFSPNGRRIASAGRDVAVKVWDPVTGAELFSLKGHARTVYFAVFSPDGKRLVTASTDRTARVWDADTGAELLTLRGHTDFVNYVAFSPDGRRIASASKDQTIKLWDAFTGAETLTIRGHTGYVSSVAFSPDGGQILSASTDKTVKVWDASSGEEIQTLQGHTQGVWHAIYSPDGRRIVSAGKDQLVKVWDPDVGAKRLFVPVHTKGVPSVAYSPDGKWLASASLDKTVKVWDARSGEERHTLKGHADGVIGVAYSPDGKRIASASFDRTLKVWDALSGEHLLTLKGHSDKVTCVAFSPDGDRIASGSLDKTVKLWNASSGKETAQLTGHQEGVRRVAFSPDGSRIASTSLDKTVKVWDAHTGAERLSFTGHAAHLTSLAFSPDGSRIASVGGDKTVRVWDALTGTERLSLKGHTMAISSVAFSPDGRRIVSAGYDNTIKVWDAFTGAETLTIRDFTDYLWSLVFSPDGKRLAGSSPEKTARMIDASTSAYTHTLRGHTSPPVAISLSENGRHLLAADELGNILGWDLHTGQLLPNPPAQLPPGPPVARLPDGRRVRIEGNSIVLVDEKRLARSDREKLTRWARFDPEWHRDRWLDARRSGNAFGQVFHLKRLLHASPYDGDLHAQLAHALAELGRPAEATTHLMHALFLKPTTSFAPIDSSAAGRGGEAAGDGRWKEAVAAFSLAVQQPESPPSTLTDLLLAQTAAGMQEEARLTLQQIGRTAERVDDENSRSSFLFHAAHLPCGENLAGVLVRETARYLMSRRTPAALHLHGAALYRAGRLEEAAAVLAESSQAHARGGEPQTWVIQAMAARDLGRLGEAQRHLRRVEEWHAMYEPPSWQMRVLWESLLGEARTPPRMLRVEE